MQLIPANATVYADYSAAIQGIQNVEIRPKIDGCVEALYLDEGAAVHKG